MKTKTITFYKYLDKFDRENILNGTLPNLTGFMWYDKKEARQKKGTYKDIDKTSKLYKLSLVMEKV